MSTSSPSVFSSDSRLAFCYFLDYQAGITTAEVVLQAPAQMRNCPVPPSAGSGHQIPTHPEWRKPSSPSMRMLLRNRLPQERRPVPTKYRAAKSTRAQWSDDVGSAPNTRHAVHPCHQRAARDQWLNAVGFFRGELRQSYEQQAKNESAARRSQTDLFKIHVVSTPSAWCTSAAFHDHSPSGNAPVWICFTTSGNWNLAE